VGFLSRGGSIRLLACPGICRLDAGPLSAVTPHLRLLLRLGNACWGNDVILDYLVSGRLSWRPLGSWGAVEYQHPGGPPPNDFIGINYYSRWGVEVAAWEDSVGQTLLGALEREPCLGFWSGNHVAGQGSQLGGSNFLKDGSLYVVSSSRCSGLVWASACT
jgi:hypothetical protein